MRFEDDVDDFHGGASAGVFGDDSAVFGVGGGEHASSSDGGFGGVADHHGEGGALLDGMVLVEGGGLEGRLLDLAGGHEGGSGLPAVVSGYLDSAILVGCLVGVQLMDCVGVQEFSSCHRGLQ